MNWIKLEDKTPELNTQVLVSLITDEKELLCYIEFPTGELMFIRDDGKHRLDCYITHWIEVPELFKQ